MSFKNKLGRTVSYSVLLSGLVFAANANAAIINVDSNQALEDNVTYVAGDVLNITNGTLGFIGDAHDITFEEGSSAVVNNNGEQAGGIGNSGKLIVNGGNIVANGAGDFDWDKNAQVAGYNGVEINGGNIDLNGNAAIFSGGISSGGGSSWTGNNVDIKGGKVNLNGGTIYAASNPSKSYKGAINISGGEVNVAAGQSGQLVAADVDGDKGGINLNGGTINNNGTLNLFKNKSSTNAALTGGKTGEADGTLNMTAGIYNSDNGTLNGDLKIDGTNTVNEAVSAVETDSLSDEEAKSAQTQAALDAAPKANFTGANIVNGDITNAMGIINIAQGASLAADSLANNGIIDLSGKLNVAVTNNGEISVKNSNANMKSMDGGNLSIDSAVKLSTLFSETSSADQVYVSKGGSLILDQLADKVTPADSEENPTVEAQTFTTDDLVSYGMATLAADFSSDKVKIGREGALNLGSYKLSTGTETTSETGELAHFWDKSSLGFNIDKVNNAEGEGQKGGQIGGNVELLGQVDLKPVVAIDAGVTEAGNTYKFVDGSVSKIADSAWNVINNNLLYNVGFSEDSDSELTISKKGASAVSESVIAAGGSANDAAVVNAWVGGNANAATLSGASQQMAQHLHNLAQTNPGALTAATTALAPEAQPVVDSVSTETNRQIFNVAGGRMDSGSGSGMSSGENPFKKAGLWIQGLMNKSKLDTRNGFDADTYGTAVGADGYINENTKVGLGYAFTNSDIDSTGRKTDVNTNTGFLYGEYNAPSYYVNAVATYGVGSYKEKKNVAGVRVDGDYDVDAFGIQSMAGYKMGDFTPEAGLRYINTKQEAYTDTAGQRVGANSTDTLTAILGAKYGYDMQYAGYNFRPEVKLAATYDLMRDKNASVVSLANGSAYVVDGENLKRFGIEAGAKVNMDVTDQVKLGVAYEGRFKDHYTDHTGLLEARYNF